MSDQSSSLVTVSEVLTAAFLDDPLMGWLFEDDSVRPAQLSQWWTWMMNNKPGHAEAAIDADGTSASLWYGPDPDEATSDAQSEFPELLISILGSEVGVAKLQALSVLAEAHPKGERHWYLAAVGTRPEHQGRGLGAALLQPALDQADADGIACYLESSNERNVPFYERLGFEVIGRIQIVGGPPMVPMWRSHR